MDDAAQLVKHLHDLQRQTGKTPKLFLDISISLPFLVENLKQSQDAKTCRTEEKRENTAVEALRDAEDI